MKRWPARLVLFLIGFYRVTLSPLLHALGGPSCGCRYYPSCSEYGSEAVRRFGAVRGSMLAFWRVLRCAPWGRGGFDPVPESWNEARPRHSRKCPHHHHHG